MVIETVKACLRILKCFFDVFRKSVVSSYLVIGPSNGCMSNDKHSVFSLSLIPAISYCLWIGRRESAHIMSRWEADNRRGTVMKS